VYITLKNQSLDEQTKQLLNDKVIVRLVKVVDRAKLSILELLEYGIALKEINHALANGIIMFDKTIDKQPTGEYGPSASGDYYFSFLNSKVKLTDLGLFMLQQIQNKS
jgi:hypothetical protein